MKTFKLIPALSLALLVSLGFLSGCDNNDPVDNAADSIEEGANDTGRAIDDATD